MDMKAVVPLDNALNCVPLKLITDAELTTVVVKLEAVPVPTANEDPLPQAEIERFPEPSDDKQPEPSDRGNLHIKLVDKTVGATNPA